MESRDGLETQIELRKGSQNADNLILKGSRSSPRVRLRRQKWATAGAAGMCATPEQRGPRKRLAYGALLGHCTPFTLSLNAL